MQVCSNRHDVRWRTHRCTAKNGKRKESSRRVRLGKATIQSVNIKTRIKSLLLHVRTTSPEVVFRPEASQRDQLVNPKAAKRVRCYRPAMRLHENSKLSEDHSLSLSHARRPGRRERTPRQGGIFSGRRRSRTSGTRSGERREKAVPWR